MAFVSVDFDVVASDGEFCCTHRMCLQCVPRVGDDVQPFADMDNVAVRRVVHHHDGSVTVFLGAFDYKPQPAEKMRKVFADLGCSLSMS